MLSLGLLLNFGALQGQTIEKVDHINFGGGRNPIKVEATRSGDTFSFFVTNESHFLYDVQIKFTEFYNLRPQVGTQTITARPGRNTLFNLTIVNKDISPRYSFSTQARLSPELATTVDERYPYLVPLREGTIVHPARIGSDGAIRPGSLMIDDGDTVRAMRKGVVTSTPQFGLQGDKLAQGAIEVLHQDGSVAFYHNVDARSFCKYGDRVLPGQPLGTLPPGMPLSVQVFRFTERNNFVSFNYLIATGDDQTIPSTQLKEGWAVVHPVPVVLKELSKREAKRLATKD